MLKSLIILLLILILTLSSFAQVDTSWVRRYNGPRNDNDGGNAICLDGSGNVYVTGGSFNNRCSFDYITIKYDSTGNKLWVRSYNRLIYPCEPDEPIAIQNSAMAIDSSGNVYVIGCSFSRETDADYLIIKYFPNGDTCWIRKYNGPANSGDWGYDVVVDESENIYVTGISRGIGTLDDYATIKYHPNGDTAWVRRFNSPHNSFDYAFALTVDNSGKVYVTGNRGTIKYDAYGNQLWVGYWGGEDIYVDDSGNVYIAGSIGGKGTGDDYTTIKYYPDGDTAWVRIYNGPNNDWDRAKAITIDGFGNVYVTGSSADIGPDYLTIKYYPNGDTAWIRRYNGPDSGGDFTAAIALDSIGNIYVTGLSQSRETRFDYTTVKYYPDGEIAWVKRYNGPENKNDKATDIKLDSFGNIYVTGASEVTWGSSDFATVKYYQRDETKDWKIYRDEKYGFEIKYPKELINLSKEGDRIVMIHSIPFKHQNPCDFKGGAPPLKELTDFRITLKVFEKNLKGTIMATTSEYFTSQMLIDDTLKLMPRYIDKVNIVSFNGYRIANGIEGCGYFSYYLPVTSDYTLMVERTYITELLPFMKNREKYLEIPGVISPDDEERLFNQIISTFRFLK